jgi:ubiquinone/menaquinone biosynthesis C-methylase UbiE
MSYLTEPPKEHPSAYMIEDRGNLEEMSRLEVQGKMLTKGMGGVLPELPDPTSLRHVLDVGCGTGDWLIELALTAPGIKRLVGVDVSLKIVEYARARAKAEAIDERVQFQTMDALRILQFPANSFDLVNQRFGFSWLRTWEWRKILLEYHRVTRPGGIIRITEPHITGENNSPALTTLNALALQAHYCSGRLFAPGGDGVIHALEPLMRRHALQDVQTQLHTLVYRAGTVEAQYAYEDVKLFYRVGLPFFQKWTRLPTDYQQIYQQALKDMRQPDFVSTWTLLTVWGTKPMYGEPLLMRGLR